MKEISELNFPDDLKYTEEHEWAKKSGEEIIVGITDYAQDQLGDVVFVELPETGTTLEKGDAFGTVESVKAVSELFMPVGGRITGINSELESAPEKVNESPYQEGWMIKVAPGNPDEYGLLMDKEAYVEVLKGD